MEIIKIGELSLMPLQVSNVYDLREWDKYESPLFADYNFPDLDDYEIKKWFYTRTGEPSVKSFAVLLDEKKTIGLINLKNIRRILKVASLGIVFDPKYIGKGYGTTALKALIKYYFEAMQMRALYLEVATHNTRAIRCYEKCGFKKVKKYTIRVIDLIPEEIPSCYKKEDFLVKNGEVHIYCYKMRLGRNDYKQHL